MRIAVYPGSFDPITNGHLEVLKRALNIFDRVIVLVAINRDKDNSRFSIKDRVDMIKEAVDNPNVEVDSYDGLTVKYAREHGAKHLIRGLRAVSDFEYEFQLASANEYVDPSIDMVFFMSHAETTFISSSSIDELHRNGVDISKLVPASVMKMYNKKK